MMMFMARMYLVRFRMSPAAFFKAASVSPLSKRRMKLKIFSAPIRPSSRIFTPLQFAVEDEDPFPVREGHVVFNADVPVLKGAPGVGDEKGGPGKPGEVVFPDRADVPVDLPGLRRLSRRIPSRAPDIPCCSWRRKRIGSGGLEDRKASVIARREVCT